MLHIPQNVVKTALDRSHPNATQLSKKQRPLPLLKEIIRNTQPMKRVFSFKRKKAASDAATDTNTLISKQKPLCFAPSHSIYFSEEFLQSLSNLGSSQHLDQVTEL